MLAAATEPMPLAARAAAVESGAAATEPAVDSMLDC